MFVAISYIPLKTLWISLVQLEKSFTVFPHFVNLEHLHCRDSLYHRQNLSLQTNANIYFHFCILLFLLLSLWCPSYQLLTLLPCAWKTFSWLSSISSVLLKLRANHTDFFFSSPLSDKLVSMGLKEASSKKGKVPLKWSIWGSVVNIC